MKGALSRWMLGAVLVGGIVSVAGAEEGVKTLPTLLIKGEVVSLDSSDPTTPLLKVKDRYGFETPIFLTNETKITKADQPVASADLGSGTSVEVEYNFDVNTAKRHAVSVKVAAPVEAAPAMAAPEAPAEPAAAAPAEEPSAPEAEVAPAVTE